MLTEHLESIEKGDETVNKKSFVIKLHPKNNWNNDFLIWCDDSKSRSIALVNNDSRTTG